MERRIAIIGAGTIGTGVAINAAQNGCHVLLIDTDPAAAARAKRRAGEVFTRAILRRKMKERERAGALSRFEFGAGIADVARADLIIEAVNEDFAVKADVLAAVSRHAQPNALIATSTSGLRLSRLAAQVLRPERFLGLHYFAPAEHNPAVELVRADSTAQETVERAFGFLQATRRVVLVCRDSPGFALTRFFCAYLNEAAHLLGEGAGTIGEIERAADEAFGATVGPFRVMNMMKPRAALDLIHNLAELGPFYLPAPRLVEFGEREEPIEIDPPPPLDEARHEALIARVRGAVFLALLQEFDEDIAEPRTLDIGARYAFQFTRAPSAMIDALGRKAVEPLLAPILARCGAPMPASIALAGRLTK